MRKLVVILIGGYRYAVSPFLGNSCRFHPTCSQYAIEAIEKYGVLRGSLLACRRLLRCHPWHSGGIDPVPSCSRTSPSLSREDG